MSREAQRGLVIRELAVSLQKQEILHRLSLEASEGEFLSLLGESGCGKSTLLKSIAGLLEADSGEVVLNGRNLLREPPEKRGTVIVFQDLRLFPHMTAEQNIAFPMEIKKVPKSQQKETVKKLLKEVQMSGFEKRKIRELSGGQMQRVALARALAAEPEILLLDEPFSGLDERLRLEMGSLVKKIHRERGITTILVTHDKREALQLSDRIVLMSGGRVLQQGTPEELFYRPVSKEAAEYFGKVNYLRGRVLENMFVSQWVQIPISNLNNWHGRRRGEAEVMVRPFSVRLTGAGSFAVKEVTFMGEMAELSLETPSGPFLCQMMSRELEQTGITTGGKAGIEIEEAYCI